MGREAYTQFFWADIRELSASCSGLFASEEDVLDTDWRAGGGLVVAVREKSPSLCCEFDSGI